MNEIKTSQRTKEKSQNKGTPHLLLRYLGRTRFKKFSVGALLAFVCRCAFCSICLRMLVLSLKQELLFPW